MAATKTKFIVLLIALIGSNAYWVYQSIDIGISYSYVEADAVDCHKMLRVAVAVIPVAADPGSTKADIVLIANDASNADSFEKDGLVWFDGLGLGFNDAGRVAIASSGPIDSFWPQP